MNFIVICRRIDDFSYSLDPYDISKAPVMTRDEEGKVMVAGGVTLKTSLKQKMVLYFYNLDINSIAYLNWLIVNFKV